MVAQDLGFDPLRITIARFVGVLNRAADFYRFRYRSERSRGPDDPEQAPTRSATTF